MKLKMEAIEKSTVSKSCLFETNNKIEKSLARLTK
jgi:hypothetical protein